MLDSPDDTLELVARWQTAQDRAARDKLVRRYSKHIRWLTDKSAASNRLDRDDAFQEGVLGFMHALDRFDPSHSVKLMSYAGFEVRRRVLQLRTTRRAVHIPVAHTGIGTSLLSRAAKDLRHSGVVATEEALAAKLGWTLERVRRTRMTTTAVDRSLDAPLLSDGGTATMHDIVAGDQPRPDEAFDAKAQTEEFRAALEQALGHLTPRRAEIVRLWLAQGCEDMVGIAERLGVTRAAVSLAIKLALPRLRDVLAGDERVVG